MKLEGFTQAPTRFLTKTSSPHSPTHTTVVTILFRQLSSGWVPAFSRLPATAPVGEEAGAVPRISVKSSILSTLEPWSHGGRGLKEGRGALYGAVPVSPSLHKGVGTQDGGGRGTQEQPNLGTPASSF